MLILPKIILRWYLSKIETLTPWFEIAFCLVRILFLIKFQLKKFPKLTTRKQFYSCKIMQDKGAASTSNYWYICIFFVCHLNKNLIFLFLLRNLFLVITRTSSNCLHSSSRVLWNEPQKIPQSQRRQGSLLKVVKAKWSSSSMKTWSRLLIFKICFLKITKISLLIWAISSQWQTLSLFLPCFLKHPLPISRKILLL